MADRRTMLMALIAVLSAPSRSIVAMQRTAGILTIDLDLYAKIIVKHGGKEVELTPKVIFDELTKDNQ